LRTVAKDIFRAASAIFLRLQYETKRQIRTAARMIPTIVPAPIKNSFTVTSRLSIVKIILSYQGPDGTTSLSQFILV